MKNERFHNSRIFDCFKRFICIFSCFILCICLFPPSLSFADTTIVDFPLPVSSTSPSVDTIKSTGRLVISRDTDLRYYLSSADNTFIYSYGSSYYLFACCPTQFTYYFNYFNQALNESSTYNSTYDFYISRTQLYSGSDGLVDIPHFNTEAEAIAAIKDYIENPPSSDPVYDDLPDFNIQRGYAAYIDFGSNWSSRSCSGILTSTFPQYSSLISGDWDGTDNRRYFWTDSLPTNTSFSSNVGSAIDWTKVAPYDLLQRSKNGIWFIQSNSPQNRYLVIVNPNQWRYGQNPSDDTINSPIKVSDLSGSTGEVKFFALNQQFDQNGTLVSSASDQASNNRTGTYDPNTNEWSSTDSSGTSADQVPGGQSDTPVISSISDYIANITTTLTNFVNSVIALIQAPISHISQLIEAGSGFMSALRGMYAWLPVDIQGLVISALTVVIGIGVFKVFL